MKRTLATTALVVGAALCLPAFAQQAPASPTAPNPSAPPIEGAGASRNQPAASDMSAASGPGATKDTMKKSKSDKASRSKKPREQGAPPSPTADAPSGPKGDSPDPAPKQ
ncbi:hypothetical protein [Cupriavidus sp. UYPR2.512]|uniref:hypothetical protein n=1 Tax=Cupriavidus sp. UYPR2.512 TaxID=1080187 RepID=UPI000367BFA5|nr:hypothetical protein [Cupriavidus sp. UYPR2.512]UIF90762.1 hypothetical protein KAF44_31660 [Cupriavidus necator]